MPQKIEISSKTIIFTVFFLLFLNVVWLVRELIYSLFLAFIFMSALKPAVNGLERRIRSRVLATLLVFLAAIVVLFFIVSFIVPPLFQESVSFISSIPMLLQDAAPQLSSFVNISSVTSFLPDITQNFFKVVTGLFSNLIFVITILFFTFYFLLEEKFFKNFLDKFLDEKKTEEIITIISKAEKRMGAWMWGEILLMTIIGIMTFIGLSMLHVRYALPLAVLAGVFEVVPMIGPIFSAVPALFVALSTSWVLGLSVSGLYVIIQQLENNLVVPFVMNRAVGLHPLTTLIAISIGGKLGGLLGVILSVPVALFVETIVVEFTRPKKK